MATIIRKSFQTGERTRKCVVAGAALLTHDYALQNQKPKIKKTKKSCKCPDCGLVFGLMSTLLQHMHKHTGEKPFRCSECGAAFAYECSLQYHMRIHKTKLCERNDLIMDFVAGDEQSQPPLGCTSENDLKRKLADKKCKPKSAKLCPKKTSAKVTKSTLCEDGSVQKVKRRERKHHSIETKNEHIMNQKKKRVIKSKKRLLRKEIEDENMRLGDVPAEIAAVVEVVEREIANKVSQTILASALGLKLAPVKIVEKKQAIQKSNKKLLPADSSQTVTIMSEKRIKVEKPFKCSMCNLSFMHSMTLQEHMRKHTGETPFKCSECGAEFAYECSLQFHARLHTTTIVKSSNVPTTKNVLKSNVQRIGKTFVCHVCGAAYTRNANLQTHMRLHCGDSPYMCCVCGNESDSKRSLKRHMRLHSGEKLFNCSRCWAAFKSKASLRLHVAKKHVVKRTKSKLP